MISALLEIWEFLVAGRIFMGFIALASFVALAVAIHIGLSLRKGTVVPEELMKEIDRADRHFQSGNAEKLRDHFENTASTLSSIGRVAMSDRFSDREEATQAVEATAREEVVRLQTGMGILEVVITIAPLLGLLGTVSGLVSVFATLGTSGDEAADPAMLAAGIATALNTTIAGLVVAILTVIVHSIFTRRIESLAARMEVLMSSLLHTFYKRGGPGLYDLEEGELPPVEVETLPNPGSQEPDIFS
ncbi:MAG: MotA/TolQ/ExbB proton channel family protein [Verrucomicrobiales bacterium]|nr:MotA/TolQ/ExbB proton channel family protein [Verrucomicrobiales bacterium]